MEEPVAEKVSAVQQLKALDEQRAKILETAKTDALAKANEAVEGNCSGPRLRFQAAQGRGRPPRVRRMASMARIDLRRAVSTTDRISA